MVFIIIYYYYYEFIYTGPPIQKNAITIYKFCSTIGSCFKQWT